MDKQTVDEILALIASARHKYYVTYDAPDKSMAEQRVATHKLDTMNEVIRIILDLEEREA